jgi:outer membrane protein assembly factor BamA
VELAGLRGVVFYDMGSAWFDWEPFIPFAKNGWFYRLNDPPEGTGLYAGLGFGLRLYMGYFTLKTDFARRTNWVKILSKEDDGLPDWVFHLSFGSDF